MSDTSRMREFDLPSEVVERHVRVLTDAVRDDDPRLARRMLSQRWRGPAWTVGITVALAAVTILLVAPWHRGVATADAALVLQRTQQAAAPPHRGWILHEVVETVSVPYPGAGHYVRSRIEIWRQTSPPYRFRTIGSQPFGASPVESGGVPDTDNVFAFDPVTKTLYQDTTAYPARAYAANPGVDTGQNLRRAITHGKVKVIGKTRVNGKSVYKLRDEKLQTTYYVDAKTYTLLRTQAPGFPLKQPGGHKSNPFCESYSSGPSYPDSTTTSTILEHEYLPPTAANLKLANVKAQHPRAKAKPATREPRRFHESTHPFQCFVP